MTNDSYCIFAVTFVFTLSPHQIFSQRDEQLNLANLGERNPAVRHIFSKIFFLPWQCSLHSHLAGASRWSVQALAYMYMPGGTCEAGLGSVKVRLPPKITSIKY